MMKTRLTAWFILTCSLAITVGGQTQTGNRKLNMDWIFDADAGRRMNLPDHVWLQDGTALLYDVRLAPGERTIERFHPETGQRQPACDAGKALASLTPLLDTREKDAARTLDWPDSISRNGHYGLYLIHDDLFLLDIPASTFRRLTRTSAAEKSARFSPDGTKVAFIRDNDLFVIDVGSGAESRLTTDGSDTRLNGTLSWVYWEEIFGRTDLGYWWAPDSSTIAFLQSDESMVDLTLFPDFKPVNPRIIRQRYPKAGDRNPVVRVGVIRLEHPEPLWINLGSPAPEYVVRVNWLPDSKRLAVQTLNRRQDRLDLNIAPVDTGKAHTILTETTATSINIHDDLHFISGGDRFIWSSERDGYNHLYLYDIDGKLVRRLTSGEWMVRASSGVAWVRGGVCAIDESGHWIYFTANRTSPIAPQLYRVKWDGGNVEAISHTAGTHRISFDPSCRFYFDAFSNAATLPGLYLHRVDGALSTTVASPAMSLLAPFNLRFPEFLTIPADDGFPLPAQIMKPASLEPGRRYPVILYVYGGPSAPVVWNSWQRETLFNNLLLQNGFICFSVDNRSASGLSKKLEDTVHGKLLSGGEVEDILAAVRWLQHQDFVDPDRIGVWGWSGGGSMTLQLMTHSTAFKAGIAVAAVTDFRYYDTKWTENILGLPQDNPTGYDDGAPANFADRLSGHLLLTHGTYDDNVHPQNVWRFAHELIKADKLYDMVMYPMEKHGIRGARKHVFTTMLTFWRNNL